MPVSEGQFDAQGRGLKPAVMVCWTFEAPRNRGLPLIAGEAASVSLTIKNQRERLHRAARDSGFYLVREIALEFDHSTLELPDGHAEHVRSVAAELENVKPPVFVIDYAPMQMRENQVLRALVKSFGGGIRKVPCDDRLIADHFRVHAYWVNTRVELRKSVKAAKQAGTKRSTATSTSEKSRGIYYRYMEGRLAHFADPISNPDLHFEDWRTVSGYTLAQWLNERGIYTPSGQRFDPDAVRNLREALAKRATS